MVDHAQSFLTVREFIDMLPRPVTTACVTGWMRRGVRGERLESVLVGGKRLIPRTAAETFLSKIVTPSANR